MPPVKTTVIPHKSLSDSKDSFNILVKLNDEILASLRDYAARPKLVVKKGEMFLKLSQDLIPTKALAETARIDLIQNVTHDKCVNLGRVDLRLNLLVKDKSRQRLIQSIARPRSETGSNKTQDTHIPTRSLPNSPHVVPSSIGSSSSGSVSDEDVEPMEESWKNVVPRLVHLLALGPISLDEIKAVLPYIDGTILAKYGAADANGNYVLKDTYYKSLSLSYYTEEQKRQMVPIIGEKLGQLGYDNTNSTRVRITQQLEPILDQLKDLKRIKSEKLDKAAQLKELEAATKKKKEQELKKPSPAPIVTPKVSSPQEPSATGSKTLEKRRKRTISDSSNSSVNSMKSSLEADSPYTSPEEIDENLALNEYKRQKTASVPSSPRLTQKQSETLEKFNKKYAVYSNLYHNLFKKKVKSRTEFKKLVSLESEVKLLKKQLYKLDDASK